MKRIILLLIISFTYNVSYSQVNVIVEPRANVAMAAIGVVNLGAEFGVSKHSSVGVEYLGSFAADSFLGTGYPFLATVGYLDYRYYTKENLSGFFVGGSFGIGTWKMTRSILPFTYNQPAGNYDVGSSLMLGLNIGYKFLIEERWGIEISMTGGWVHSKHEGYNKHGVLTYHMNLSDEFLPFKGGVYVTYRLGVKKKKY